MSNNMNLVTQPANKIKNKVICDGHFKIECFMNWKKERLIKSAVPTIMITEDGSAIDLEENPQDFILKNEQIEVPRNFMVLAERNSNSLNETATSTTPPSQTSNTKTTINLSELESDPITLVLQNPRAERSAQNSISSKPQTKEVTCYSKPTHINEKSSATNSKAPSIQTPPKIIAGTSKCTATPEKIIQQTPERRLIRCENLNQAKNYIIQKGRSPVSNMVFRKLQPKLDSPVKPPLVKRIKLSESESPVKLNEEMVDITDEVEIIPFVQEDEEKDDEKEMKVEAKPIPEINHPTETTSTLLVKALIESRKKIEELNLKLSALQSQVQITNQPEKPIKTEPLQLNKAQLFNGIKKYLNPSMSSLLRIELFETQGRQWKNDEKSLSVELYKLGQHVYEYMRDEMRFRLPPSALVEKWIADNDHLLDDLDDAC